MLCSMEFLKFCFLEIVYLCSVRKSAADISACGNVQIMREYLPDTQPTLEPITTAFQPLAAVATYS